MRSVESRHHRQAGMRSVTWDLRSEDPRPREMDGLLSSDDLRDVLPGEYVVSLKVGDTTLKQSIVVEEGWVERMPGRIR